MFNSIQFSAETHAKRVSTITDDRFDFKRDLEITRRRRSRDVCIYIALMVWQCNSLVNRKLLKWCKMENQYWIMHQLILNFPLLCRRQLMTSKIEVIKSLGFVDSAWSELFDRDKSNHLSSEKESHEVEFLWGILSHQRLLVSLKLLFTAVWRFIAHAS